MTDEELQSVIEAVLASLKTNGKTIAQLTEVTSLSESDYFEISDGRKVSYSVLAGLLSEIFADDLEKLSTDIANATIESVEFTVGESTATLTVKQHGFDAKTASVPVSSSTQAGIITAEQYAKYEQAAETADEALAAAQAAQKDADAHGVSIGEVKNLIEDLDEQVHENASGITTNASDIKEIKEKLEKKADLDDNGYLVAAQSTPVALASFGKVIDGSEPSVSGGDRVYDPGDNTIVLIEDGNEAEGDWGENSSRETPNENIIYLDKANGLLYRWDDDQGDMIQVGGQNTDSELDESSDNPVGNAAVAAALKPRLFFNANVMLGSSKAMTLDTMLTLTSSEDTYGYAHVKGAVLTFLTDDGWRTYQYYGTSDSEDEWEKSDNWVAFGTAIGNCYNVTNEVPISGYYSLATAIAATYAKGLASTGMQITFAVGENSWKTYQYVGSDTTEENFTNADYWVDMAGLTEGSEPMINIDYLCGAFSGGYYTLQYAIAALLALEQSKGITYQKSGLVITFQSGENTWEAYQFNGDIADFSETALWTEFGAGGGGDVETSDEPAEGGKDAFSTGGAYKYIPVGMGINAEEEGVVKLWLVNAAGEQIGDEVQFAVGTGSGGSGTIVTVQFESSAMYFPVGQEAVIAACIRSVTSGATETYNGIEYVELYDRTTNTLLKTYNFNGQPSSDEDVYDFEMDISSYVTSAGSTKFKVIAYDDTGATGSRNFTVTAVDVTVVSTQTLHYTSASSLVVGGAAKSISMYKFPNNASANGITAITEIYINGAWQELGRATITDTYSHTVSINASELGLTHGAYPIRIHGVDETAGVTGNYLHTAVMCVESGNTTPIVVSRWYTDEETGTIKRYESVSIDFAAYTAGSSTTSVEVYEDGTKTQTTSAAYSTTYTYTHQVSGSSGTVSVYFKAGTSVSQTTEYNISGSAIDAEQTEGAIYSFDFASRSNSDTDKTIEDGDYAFTVNNSNWSSNGFGTFDGVNCLAVKEGVTASLNHVPFTASVGSNGVALLFRFASQYSADDDAKLMQCYDESTGAGFYITGKEIVLYCTSGTPDVVRRRYPEGKPITVGIVVEPTGKYVTHESTNYSFIKLYLDGEEVGCIGYTASGQLVQGSNITFDGTYADFYLFWMMAWESYPVYRQAFYDYLLKLTDTEAMITEYDFENVWSNTGVPDAAAMYANGMSYLVEAPYNGSDITALDDTESTSKKIYITLYYYDVEHPWRAFKATDVQRRNQGTTSAKRPIKNARYYLGASKGSSYDKSAKTGGTVIEMIYSDTEVAAMGLTADQLADYELAKSLAAINKVRVGDNTIPVDIITVKVDYSDSSNANDCGACNMMNATLRSLGDNFMTPAQRYYDGTFTKGDVSITGLEMNHSTANHPIAMFRAAGGDLTDLTFYAKGNWKEDKKEQVALGFMDTPGYNKGCLNYGDFVEYFGAEGESLSTIKTNFLADTSVDTTKIYKLTPYCSSSYRFMVYEDGAWAESTGNMYQSGGKWVIEGNVLNPVDGFEVITYADMAWFRGVSSIDDMMAPVTKFSSWVQKLVDGEEISISTAPAWTVYFECMIDDDQLQKDLAMGKKVPYFLYRLLVFCNSCDYEDVSNFKAVWMKNMYKYINPHALMAYNAFTDYNAAVDQQSKNFQPMFFLDEGGSVTGGDYDDETKVRMYPNKIYDADTLNGKDNDGKATIDPEVDPNEPTDEDTGYENPYAGWGSVLWRNLYYQPEVYVNADGDTVTMKSVVSAMRSTQATVDGKTFEPFSPTGAKYFFIEKICKAWQKTISSCDGEQKYIDNPDNYGHELYFYAMYGLRLTELEAFIDTRWRFRDGFYATGDFFSGVVSFRSNSNSSATIPFTAAKSGYFGIGNDASGNYSQILYVEEGESAEFTDFDHTTGALLYIYQCDRMSKLDLSQVSIGSSASFASCKLMQELYLGSSDHVEQSIGAYEALTTLPLGALPFLKVLDITNTSIKTVDASGCPRLETFIATGSPLTTVSFAETSPVSTVTLPATMTSLRLVNLPKLYYTGGLTLEGYSSIATLVVGGSDNIDTKQLLSDIINGGASLKYIRLTGLNVTAPSSLLASLMSSGCIGIDSTGTAYDESGQCSGLEGTWTFTDLVDDISAYKAYFPNLTINNAQFTAIVFDDSASDDANITNLDNGTGYDYGTSYVASGHISKIKAAIHVYKAAYDESNAKMVCSQIADDDYEALADGSSFDPTDPDGEGYDLMVGFPHYWYKGVNDYANQKKYVFLSKSESEPLSTATTAKNYALSSLLYASNKGVAIANFAEGDTFSDDNLTTSSAYNVYRIPVEGMKQVRWPGINSSSYGGVFIDSAGTVLGTHNMYVSNSLFDFASGDDIFCSVPTGSAYFLVSVAVANATGKCFTVDSDDVEAIEPDWVEHPVELVGAYMASVDSMMRMRSISGGTIKLGNGTSTTYTGWTYDSKGNPTNTLDSLTGVTLNYTWKDFCNLAKCRADGYQIADYETHKDVAILWMAIYGRRNSQAVNGTGGSGTSTALNVTAPMEESSSGRIRTLGLTDWWGTYYEWMDHAVTNADSWKQYYADKCVVSSYSLDYIWRIYRAADGTERSVQGLKTSGYCVARMRHGRYCDLVPTVLSTDNSKYTSYYCDQFFMNGGNGRVWARSGNAAVVTFGLVCVVRMALARSRSRPTVRGSPSGAKSRAWTTDAKRAQSVRGRAARLRPLLFPVPAVR